MEYINFFFPRLYEVSLEYGTLRSGNFYDLKPCPWMSACDEQPMEACGPPSSEQGDEASTEFSHNLTEERTTVNLEPQYAQISTLTQMMNNLIQGNLAKMNRPAGPRDRSFPFESLFTDVPGTSRPLPLVIIDRGILTRHSKLIITGSFSI